MSGPSYRGKLIALNVDIRKERSQVNNPSFHFKKQEKEQNKAKASIRQEIKIGVEISEIENKRKKINEIKIRLK